MNKNDNKGQSKTCRACPIGCNQPREGKKNKLGIYAALWGLDRNAPGFDSFVAAYHYHCDDIGLDAFELAGAIALALEARRIARSGQSILNVVEEISLGTGLGLIIGNGAEAAAHAWKLAPPDKIPRKEIDKSDEEKNFLDSVGLCALAYSDLDENPDLWNALGDMLKAKYGRDFNLAQLRFNGKP